MTNYFPHDENIKNAIKSAADVFSAPSITDIETALDNAFAAYDDGAGNLKTTFSNDVVLSSLTIDITGAVATDINALVTAVANIPEQGQAAASLCLPVVLPALQIAPATPYHGQTTDDTSGTVLGSSQSLAQGLTIKALYDNAAPIYVGKTGVSSSTGYELSAGESVFVACNNVATIYIIAASSGDGVSYIGI